ncbi:MAG: hypothetical protein JWO19_5663 [Bryobacterales bacterium]|nr:hypothetical protein [Bryobacterales bacterium]
MKTTVKTAMVLLCGLAGSATAWADCSSLPNLATLKTQLAAAVTTETSGLDLNMWATIVDRDGIVCAVAFSGTDRGAQWPGSRLISAQKANTANAFSLDSSAASGAGKNGLALSTANLYSAVQPGGSLFGLQESNPLNQSVAYAGNSTAGVNYGTGIDPMLGGKIGGINVFGGGLALYGPGRVILGGLGVSGDTSCADHRIAWLLRHNLGLDHLKGVAGVSGDSDRPDNIIFDLNNGTGKSAGGYGQPHCTDSDGDPKSLPAVQL